MSAVLPSLADGASEFETWWQQRGEWVEPPNLRRAGESGVQRLSSEPSPLYSKRQLGHVYYSWQAPFGLPTVARELQAYRGFAAAGVQVPELVYGGWRRECGQWQALLITRELQNYSDLGQWWQRAPSAAQVDLAVQQLAMSLVQLHRAGWQHGGLYPKHIFVREAPAGGFDVAFLDLERSRKRRPRVASERDLAQLRRRWCLTEAHWRRFSAAYQLAWQGA